MAQATDLRSRALRSDEPRIIGLVSAAHFVSHYYILLLPPLFAFIRADYGVSYTELGLAIAAFNVGLDSASFFVFSRISADRYSNPGLSSVG